MYYRVISLNAAKKYKRILKSMFINPCVAFVLLWGYIAYFSQPFSFLVYLKNSQKEFPRGCLFFHLTTWGPVLPVHLQGGKRSPQVVQGAASGSQLQREKMLGSSSVEALEVIWRKTPPVGAARTFWIPGGPRSL